MDGSAAKSMRRRLAICSGLQADAQRRSCRLPCRRPFQARTLGPARLPLSIDTAPPNVLPQLRVRRQLRRLRSPGSMIGVPLSCGRAIVNVTAAHGRIATQLAGDGRGFSLEAACDLPHTDTFGAKQRDLLPLGKAQVALRLRNQFDGWHPATLPEPTRPDRLRHASLDACLLAGEALSDKLPEHRDGLATGHARSPERPYSGTDGAPAAAMLLRCHRNPLLAVGVATTG